MKKASGITFQSMELNLSFAHHVAREQAAIFLRIPKVEGLSPSLDYINACAPLRSPMEMIAAARRDAPKFRGAVQSQAAEAARVGGRRAGLGSAEGDAEKRAAIERVSRFLGRTKTKSQDRGR